MAFDFSFDDLGTAVESVGKTYTDYRRAESNIEVAELGAQAKLADARANLAMSRQPREVVRQVTPAQRNKESGSGSRETIIPQLTGRGADIGMGTVLVLGLLLWGSR